MRVSIAAFALVLGAAASFAQDFRVVELMTYSGKLPCADCVGIQYVLTLRPDGRFYRQRTYLRSENTGQIVFDLGAWAVNASVLTLTSTTHDNELFAVSSAESIALVDRESNRSACLSQPELNCSLTREARAHVPLGSYLIRGIYQEMGGRRTLQPCGTPIPLTAETSGRPLLLERLSKAVAGGKPALITVTGLFEKPDSPQGGETLRIANVLTDQPGGVCPASVSVAAIVADLKPPSSSAPTTHAALSGLLAGTSWVLTEIDRRPPPAGVDESEASIRFVAQSRVSGFTGCNRFNGSYSLAGRSIHLGLSRTTRMVCPASANIEIPYMKALDDACHSDVQGDSLYLLNEAGRQVAGFRAVHQSLSPARR